MRMRYSEVAKQLLAEKFPTAKCAFIAGSITRGEGTSTSDIDLVIVYDPAVLPIAYRDSMLYHDWPIEMFVQNENSLAYFWEKDIESGCPILVNMVAEGLPIPENDLYALLLKEKAQKIIDQGSLLLSEEDILKRRYMITDNLDDILAYKNTAELYGALGWLYQELADFYLRANQKWSGRAKSISRAIKQAFPELLPEYEAAFREGFAGNVQAVEALTDKLLAPFGGRYWAGWRQEAPLEANNYQKRF